jgi:hypothetical protein
MNNSHSHTSLITVVTTLSAISALGAVSLRVDEPQFAYRYSRIAFVLGLGVILCVGGTIAAALWALFFRANTDR